MDIYEVLKKLNIKYEEVEHEPVFTAEQSQKIKQQIFGVGCKNLFLTDRKGNYYLYLIDDSKKADLKEAGKKVNVNHFSFATEEELKSIMKLEKGSVTPLGIINDVDNVVKILMDEDLKDKMLLMHPNVNTKTLAMSFDDLIKFINYTNHEYLFV